MLPNNPYTTAADAYGATAAETDQRAMEGRILLKAARQLEETALRIQSGEEVKREDISDVLEYNQKLWQLFVEDMRNPDHSLPQEIKNNIASLALFVFKRTLEIMMDTKPEKFKALVDINRNIASGLLKKTTETLSESAPEAAQTQETDSMA